MSRIRCILAFILLPAALVHADEDTLNWLLQEHATTAPAPTTQPTTQPATPPAVPLVRPNQPAALDGTLTLSTGEALTGQISTTPGKPLRVWVEPESRYLDLPLEEIAEIRATVVWERDEKQWHFIASGSDLKEFTGKTYPARELSFTFTLNDGQRVVGATVAPIYLTDESGRRMFILNKRQKGEVDQTLADLAYVQRVALQRSK